ncbi:ABC transporter ATP-binding protein [Ralstonia pickettii]|nr:ABC transporter ATP-binding protein [Ralstonia pickettii]
MKIEVKGLTKSYGDKKALDNISFTLNGSKIYGLLGRNGAGKTTFMDILSGQILANSGEIYINGEKPFDNRKLTESICLIKEGNNFKRELKIKNVLKIYSFFYPNWDQSLAEQLIEEYGLDSNAKIKTLSKGMESALGITVGLASKAPITVFDEPYIGLDAPSRKRFYDILLEEFQEEKRIVIFSTHLIDEVSLLFEEVLILKEGKLELHEETDFLREQIISVSGKEEEVKAFIDNKEVINKKQLAGMMTVYLYGTKEEALRSGLTVEGVPIQDLMIYLTDRKRGA